MINKKMKKMLEEAPAHAGSAAARPGRAARLRQLRRRRVTATVNGQKELIELTIQPDAVDPDDVDMLQDLVVAAVNEAARRVDEEVQQKLGGLMGGLGLPGMIG